MQFEELGNIAGKKLMLLPGTCCDWQTNFGTVIDSLSEKYHLIWLNCSLHEKIYQYIIFLTSVDFLYV